MWAFQLANQTLSKIFFDEVCSTLQTEFQKLLQFQFSQAYLQLLRWCSCPKIVHLAWRAVAPSAMENTAQQFDSLIEDNLAWYFDLKLKTDDQKIASFDPHAPQGSSELVELSSLANISAKTHRV